MKVCENKSSYYQSETCPRYLTKVIYQLSLNNNILFFFFLLLLLFTLEFQELHRFNSREFFTFTCIHTLPLRKCGFVHETGFFRLQFSTAPFRQPSVLTVFTFLFQSVILSLLRGGLDRVCTTGMYRYTEHVKFPKFQTGIFVEWKAPRFTSWSQPANFNHWCNDVWLMALRSQEHRLNLCGNKAQSMPQPMTGSKTRGGLRSIPRWLAFIRLNHRLRLFGKAMPLYT